MNSPIFSSCPTSANATATNVDFTGGTIGNGADFFITVADFSGTFPPTTAYLSYVGGSAVTPEPSSFFLLATGMVCLGMLSWSVRRS